MNTTSTPLARAAGMADQLIADALNRCERTAKGAGFRLCSTMA
jgi:hypothetical protein